MDTEELAKLCISKDASTLRQCIAACRLPAISYINNPVKLWNLKNRSSREMRTKVSNNETTCLNIACGTSDASVVSILLSHGARTDIKDSSFGNNSYHNACRSKKDAMEKLRLLLATNETGIHARNKTGNTPLHISAATKTPELCTLLMAKIDVNLKSNKRLVPLHVAAHFGNTKVAQSLLSKQDIDVNAKDIQGDTPMHHSANYGHLQLCALIAMHPNYDQAVANKKGITAERELFHLLLREVEKGPKENIQFLLKNCKVPCSLNTLSRTALLQACTSRIQAYEKVKFLSHHDRGLISRPFGRSRSLPIHVASSHPDDKILEFVMTFDIGCDVNVRRARQQTPLHIACRTGLVNNVRVLLKDAMIDVNVVDDKNNTPLHYASFKGYYDIIIMLKTHHMCRSDIRNVEGKTADEYMSYGVQLLVLARLAYDYELQRHLANEGVLKCDEAQNNALHIVCHSEKDASEKAELLIEYNMSLLQQRNTMGLLPIHVAIMENHLPLFNVFLPHCHHGDATSDGRQLLHVAAEHGCTIITHRVMLETGIDVNARDSNGNTAAHLAAQNGHQETLEIIQNHPHYDETVRNSNGETVDELNPVNSLLFTMCTQGLASHVKSLLDNGAKCLQDREGNTVLYAAYTSKDENLKKCEVILNHDASLVNQTNHEGRTLLHIACNDKSDPLLNFVLNQESVDLNAQDGFGMTPICVAIQVGYTKAVQLLLNRNVSIHIQDKLSRFPLHIAVRFNELEVLKALLRVPGIDVNVCDDERRTPWHLAHELKHYTALRYLTANPLLDLTAESVAGISARQVFASEAPLTDLIEENSHLLLHKSLDETPVSYYRGLTLIGECLYLSVDRTIHVYNLDLQQVDHIQVPTVDYIRTVVRLGSGDLVAATGTGLFHLRPKGEQEKKRQVSFGHYCHIQELNGRIYALRAQSAPEKMCVCEVYDPMDSWKKLLSIEVRGKFTERSKLYVTDSSIYIADGTHLHQFIHAGEDLGIMGQNIEESENKLAPGVYGWPMLSQGDTNGNVLLIDRLNHRLQVLHRDGEWSVVTLPPPIELPCGAVYVPGRLFVLSRNPGLSMCLLQP